MISLFNIPHHIIDTSKFSNLLSDTSIREFEQKFATYVGAKYACSFNSATSAIFLIFNKQGITVNVPSILPPVVANAILNGGNKLRFTDNVDWVGDSYILHQYQEYKVIDSAQKVIENQFKLEANPGDLMIFSFYPTKPISGCDGGMIVSDDGDKIEHLRMLSINGMSSEINAWERSTKMIGWKMYMNSIQAYIANQNLLNISLKYEKLEKIRKVYDKEFGKHTSCHLYRIRVHDNSKFIKEMKTNGVICGIHYQALHNNCLYNENKVILPISDQEEKTTVSIPFHEMLTERDADFVITNVNKLKDI